MKIIGCPDDVVPFSYHKNCVVTLLGFNLFTLWAAALLPLVFILSKLVPLRCRKIPLHPQFYVYLFKKFKQNRIILSNFCPKIILCALSLSHNLFIWLLVLQYFCFLKFLKSRSWTKFYTNVFLTRFSRRESLIIIICYSTFLRIMIEKLNVQNVLTKTTKIKMNFKFLLKTSHF